MYSLMKNRLGRIVVPLLVASALGGTMLAGGGSAGVASAAAGRAAEAAGAAGAALTAGHATTAAASGMLAAGQTGQRSAVPWRKVGAGWELAQYSESSTPDHAHHKAGPTILYLVDPAGGRYQMYRWPATVQAPGLLDWSGDKTRALLSAGHKVVQITLATGRVSRFRAGASWPLGYTRPSGENLLADRLVNGQNQIVRYNLHGQFQRVLATALTALESPGGTTLVVSAGNGLRLVSNAGHTIRSLPAGYRNAGCQPVRWWDSATVLASCAEKATGRTQLWQVPVGGGSPSTLTPWRHGTGADPLGDINAWQLSSGLYLQSPIGCSSMRIVKQLDSGPVKAVKIPGTDGDDHVLAARGARLLVQAETGCMGSDSLLWFNPGTRSVQMLIKAPRTIQGVVAAVPFYTRPVRV